MRNRPLYLVATSVALGLSLLAAVGCQSRPTPAPAPSAAPEPHASSLFVRNYSPFDIAVFVVPNAEAKPIWLTNVPVGASRTVALQWRDLQSNGGLVVRTQVVGSAKTWTSEPLIIDDGIVGVLDLTADASRTTAGSVLRGVTLQAFDAAMR